jgi:hypothetical protein
LTEIRNWPELTTLNYNYYVPIQLPDGTTRKIKLSTLLGITLPPSTDPLFSDVVLLMPMTTASGITDIKGKSSTNAGTSLSTAIFDPFGQNTGVVSFPGGGSRIEVPQSADFAFGNSAFAIEWWLYPLTFPTGTAWGLLDVRAGATATDWLFAGNPSGQISMYGSDYNNPFHYNFANSPLILNQWNYLCTSRGPTGFATTWINGTMVWTDTQRNNAIFSAGALLIGDQKDSVAPYAGSFTGYGSNLRITRAYRDGSIMPTTPFPAN